MKLLISLLLCLLPAAHPIHVSITEVNWNESAKSLEIAHKIFIDDLEEALRKKYGLRLYLSTDKEKPEAEQYLQQYLEENFRLINNNKNLIYNYLGKQYEEQAVWIFTEIKDIRKLKNLQIKNTILTELYEDQDNLLHFQRNKAHFKSIRTNRSTEQEQIALD